MIVLNSIVSNLIVSNLILWSLIVSNLIVSNLFVSNLIKSNLIVSNLIASILIVSNLIAALQYFYRLRTLSSRFTPGQVRLSATLECGSLAGGRALGSTIFNAPRQQT